MPPKRKRSTDAASSSSSRASATKSAKNDSTTTTGSFSNQSYWRTLVLEWRAISNNKQRCTELIQALVESKVPLTAVAMTLPLDPNNNDDGDDDDDDIDDDEPTTTTATTTTTPTATTTTTTATATTATATTAMEDEHADCYWLLLATHAMNRIVGLLEQHQSQQHQSGTAQNHNLPLATILAHLCHAVASSLLGNGGTSSTNKLDRLSHKPVRSIVGRAMVTLTVASTVALQTLKSEQVQSIWCAVLSLDMVIHQSSNNNSSNKATVDGWHHAMAALTHNATAAATIDGTLDFDATDQLLQPTTEERTCLQALLDRPKTMPSLEEMVTHKRRRRLKKQAAAAATAPSTSTVPSLGACFGKHLQDNSTIVLDGRMSMRRWPSMAFTWLCQGQERILQVAHDLLMAVLIDDSSQEDAMLLLQQFDCPAVTVTNSSIVRATASAKRGSKKAKAAAAQATPTATSFCAIPGNVAIVTLVTRLFAICAESSSQGGTRPPTTGGLDPYVQSLLMINTKQKSAATTNAKKPNILNLVVACVHSVLQLHSACLQQHCSTSSNIFTANTETTPTSATTATNRKRLVIINDDNDRAIVNGVARYCPHVHKTMEALCRNASDVSLSIRKLLALASCHVLQHVGALPNYDNAAATAIVVIDAKLCNLAVGQFHFCFSFLLHDDGGGEAAEDGTNDALVLSYVNIQPLPTPVLVAKKPPARGRGKKKAEANIQDEICTFAGVLLPQQQPVAMAEQSLLLLFFRAMLRDNNNTSSSSSSPFTMVSMLLDILECCYNTMMQQPPSTTQDDKMTKSKSTKSKKKKKAPPVAKAADAVPRLRRLNAIRAGLASDVCNVLRCLTTQHALQSYFRSCCITTKQLCRFVHLARAIETILTTTSSDGKKDAAATSFFNPSSSDFNLYERTLWSAHTNLCSTLGRGTPVYSPKKATTPILDDSKTRLAVFSEIPRAYGTKDWPLHLAASHHALVTSNLTSEFLGGVDDDDNNAPEDFVASSMIRSIAQALKDPSIVTYQKWLGSRTNGDEEQTTDERVPLSIRDGHLLLMAVSRLSPKDQIKHVSALATAMASSFAAFCKEDHTIIYQHAEVSQFLARVVTVYTSLLNLATVDLRDTLLAQVGPSQYALPQLYTLGSIISKGCLAKDGNWYKRESSFMGLYSGWESPVVPAAQIKQALPKDVLSKTNQILEHALSVGFQCAGNDFGQLLFSTWNATGRKLTWDPKSLEQMSIQPFNSPSKSLSALFLELREEICYVFIYLVGGTRESLPESLVGQILKSTIVKKQPLKETLGEMLEKASRAIDYLVEIAEEDDGLDATGLALLEGLPVYIAFIMAMHTTTNDSLFSRPGSKKKGKIVKRNRIMQQSSGSGYDIELLPSIMSDEDSVGSEDDCDYQDGEDGNIDALARLHDACNAFGAAPMHPDWLDSGCFFRGDITAVFAGQNAARAVECLTKLGSLASAQHTSAVKNCMTVLAGRSPGDESSHIAASLCCMAVDFSNGMLEEGEDCKETEFQKAVASVFEIPHVAIQDFYNDSASTGWRAAKEAWIPNCPQQIVGVLQSQSIDGIESTSSEYRAGGEWEMMVSEALIGACTGCGMDDTDYTIWKSFKVSEGKSNEKARLVFDTYAREERWLRITQGLIAQLMPAAALLRFSAAAGKGRDTHPLSVREGAKGAESLSFGSSAIEYSQFSHPAFSLTTEQINALSGCVALLAHRSARCNGDAAPKLSCTAVAANLLVEARPFGEIEGIDSLCMAFEALESVQVIASIKKPFGKDRLSSFRLISDLLVKMIQVRGHSSELSMLNSKDSKVMRFLMALCSGPPLEASILGIARFEQDILVNDAAPLACAIKSLIFILCSDEVHVDALSRARVASMLGEVMQMEGQVRSAVNAPDIIQGAMLKALVSLDVSRLKKLVELAYPENVECAEDNRQAAEAAIGAAKILACVLSSSESPTSSLKFCRKVFGQLQTRFSRVSTVAASRESSLGILFLYACRVGSLDSVGSSMVANLSAEGTDESDLVPMECLLSFVQGLRVTLGTDATSVDEPESAGKAAPSNAITAADNSDVLTSKTPRACSHVLRNGFFQQHWYNCYTCGLVFDKGCCTICALTCHRGHEVAYSRFSSFFCDCGAEVSSAGEQNRVVCKCVALVSVEEAEKIFREEKVKNHWRTMPELSNSVDAGTVGKTTQPSRVIDLFVDVAKIYTTDAMSAVETIKVEASRASWISKVFGITKKNSQSNAGILLNDTDLGPIPLTRDSVASTLAGLCGVPLDLEPLEHLDLVPVRAARAGTFNVKMSVDSTTDRLKRAMLSRHGIVRSAVVADSRGRLIVAEASSLVFCSVIPAVNDRFVKDILTSHIGRAQMSAVSSQAVGFNIVGMQLCKENERHLVIWGTSEAYVMVLKNRMGGVERTITLIFDVDPHECESDYLLGCEWVPGSQTRVSVACGSFVKIFDISSADIDDNAVSVLSFSISYEATIKDTAWVAFPFPSGSKKPDASKRKLKLYVLVDTGRIHEIQPQLDIKGEIAGLGTSYLDRSSGCIDIPTAGVRSYEGMQPGKAGTSTRSLGEGCSLCFLPQCALLLYKCTSSCVVAISFDEMGEVQGSFELLPNRVESYIFSSGSDSHSIMGPFSHWTEMGITQGGFRLVCVGKSSRTSQPKLLCVDINEKSVKVKDITWSTGRSVGLGLSLSSSFEGLVPFSAPVQSPAAGFVECLFLCAVTSNGSLLIYGQDDSRKLMSEDDSGNARGEGGVANQVDNKPGKPSMALTLYEDLLNVTEVDELKFAGDGIGSDSDSIKSKLSAKNSVYLMSPSRDGCTVTVSLDGEVEISKIGDVEGTTDTLAESPAPKDEKQRAELVIVALRLLVGSTTTDCLPRQVFVQGRPIDLMRDVKRWYDLPLTLEEVVMSLRNGFVSIGLGRSFEAGNSPLIDAIEVYAIERKKIQHVIPTSLQSETKLCVDREISGESNATTRTLIMTTRILSSLYQLVGATLDEGTPEGDSLKQLIQSTALKKDRSVRESVIGLLESLESDHDVRQKFLDKGTILGMSEALQSAAALFHNSNPATFEEQNLGRKVKGVLEASLSLATSIALSRPESYVSATEQLVSEKLSARSIALDSNEILLAVIRSGIPYRDILENVVHLVLAELSISEAQTESSNCEFATFAIISNLLRSDDEEIIERCCAAITSFVKTHSPTVVNPMVDIFNATNIDHSEPSAPIAYQCDSCSKFPITDTRYTILEGDHDIDLCTRCYQLGRVYAELHDFSANSPVIMNGRSIGGGTKLSCAQISQMQSVPIVNGTVIVKQVEQAKKEAKSAGNADAEDPLRRAILFSQTETAKTADRIMIHFDTFTDGLFDNILGHVGAILDGGSSAPIGSVNPLLTLLLDSITMGANENAHVSRGKRYARECMKHVRRILGSMRVSARSDKSRYILLINFLRSVSRLTGASDEDVATYVDDASDVDALSPGKSKEKTDPRFVCDAHSVPAVRRRVSQGTNKNRRFYVCGMERKQRCKYFKWADDQSTPTRPGRGPPTRLEMDLQPFIWQLISDTSDAKSISLSDQLCDLLEMELARSDANKGKELRPSEVKSCSDQLKDTNRADINSIYDLEAAVGDLNDGVFCSKEKVQGVAPIWLCKQEVLLRPKELLLPGDQLDDQALADKIIEASLDLISTVACASSSPEVKITGHSRWFSLLCEVISMSPASRFRVQAKKALKRMCDGNQAQYHSVRDHYVFGFQFKEIFNHAYSSLDGALCVREQARQCGDKWNEDEVSWQGLGAGGLLGCLDSISEDCRTVANSTRIGSLLDEVMSVTKSRGGNWKDFCSLLELPASNRERKNSVLVGQERVNVEHLFGGPPIISLFWLCCSITGSNQIKAMKLLDVALASAQDRRHVVASFAKEVAEDYNSSEGISSGVAGEVDTEEHPPSVNSAPQQAPENTLVNGPKGLDVKDIYAFSLEFVLRGRTAEARRIASQLATKMCRPLSSQSLATVFYLLVDKPMAEIEGLGCASVQYLQLLQSLLKLGHSNDELELTEVAGKVARAFVVQMNLFKLIGGKAQFELEAGRDGSMKCFDMGNCLYCHRVHSPSLKNGHGKKSSQPNKEKKSSNKELQTRNKRGAKEPPVESPNPAGPQWLPDQVRPFTSGHLEASTDNTCSGEFASFVQLKCRLSISEIHLTANDPRGRYAKSIVISFTPRQVSEVSQLKSKDYEPLWQECGTISLARGTTRCSCILPIPVTAANLKFEYRDFYDRVGESRASDGSFVLFCPRCSRQVTNAHGVCGNCGECVFQCRRCRHIQYDRPDAFLCTECGHCSSGSFSYELTAGAASNAVAIVDDESHKRTVKVSRVATKLHSELQTALVERVRTASRKRSHAEDDPLSKYSPAMKRALMGDLPVLTEDAADIESARARGDPSSVGRAGEGRASAANRARSLLRLARQLRNDGGVRASRREMLVREAFLGSNREFSLEEVDEEHEGTDIVGMFGSSDRDDPLTRLVATISGRRNAERSTSNPNSGRNNNAAFNKKESSKSSLQECEKLYQLMREAERECHELQRRLNAWSRLEHDSLLESHFDTDASFSPTLCSWCAGPVTLHLLLLMLRLFQSNKIAEVEAVITKEFVRALFLEPAQMHKNLLDLKRLAITTFCTKSEHAAKLVLEELRARLRASGDATSASILGKLLEHDFALSDQFVMLATETLQSNYMY